MISDREYLQFSPYFAQIEIEKKEERSQFLRLFEAASPQTKALLTNPDTTEFITGVARQFRLDEYDTESVSWVFRKALLGQIPQNKVVEILSKETDLDLEAAGRLWTVLDQKFWGPSPASNMTRPTPEPRPSSRTDVNPDNVIDLREQKK